MLMLVTVLAIVLSVAAGVAPTILYVLIIWWVDRYEKEPIKLLVVAFIWGALPAVIASAVLEVAASGPIAGFTEEYGRIISLSFIAPPAEEAVKGLALLALFLLARREFDDVLDGIIYGSLIGFGFAMTENVSYFLSAWRQGGAVSWQLTVLVRSLAFGFNHAMFTALTGIGFGLARYERSASRRVLWILAGLAAAITAHFTHNFFVSLDGACVISFLADWMGVLLVGIIIGLAWRRERAWIVTELGEEVIGGLLTQAEYEAIVSRRNRLSQSWQLLGQAGLSHMRTWRALVAAATELAFKKHQQAVMGEEAGSAQAIVALRARIADLRGRLSA